MRLEVEETPPEQENTLPFINVVFLLLIFFMLAGALHAVDRLNVEPPSAAGLPETEYGDPLVLLAADGRLAIGDETVDEAGLQRRLRVRLERTPELLVRLKADREVEALRVVEVMRLMQAAGVERVLMLTLERER